MNRRDFMVNVGAFNPGPDLDAVTEQAYLLQEEKAHAAMIRKPPSGRAFYASMFPGGENDKRCARQALYNMVGAVDPQPIKPAGRAVIEVGKAVEKQIVWRWGKMGLLLGGIKVPEKEYGYMNQLGFSDPDTWLSGYADAVLDLRPRWRSVLPVDIKSKSHERVTEMRSGERSYDPDHYKQVQAYLYLCRKYHSYLGWDEMGLEPAAGAIIYYVSRDNPRFSKQFFVYYDEVFVKAGIGRLTAWKENFLHDELPERPKDWHWTKPPCQWCVFKKMCKQDIFEDVVVLSESNVVKQTEKLVPNYDIEKFREEVMRRWKLTELPR
jgi:hypothetical protein